VNAEPIQRISSIIERLADRRIGPRAIVSMTFSTRAASSAGAIPGLTLVSISVTESRVTFFGLKNAMAPALRRSSTATPRCCMGPSRTEFLMATNVISSITSNVKAR